MGLRNRTDRNGDLRCPWHSSGCAFFINGSQMGGRFELDAGCEFNCGRVESLAPDSILLGLSALGPLSFQLLIIHREYIWPSG